jgi:hypothetical protein
MRFALFILAACAFLTLPACHRSGRSLAKTSSDVSFTPYSATRSEPSTDNAVRFYEGDKQTLSKVGAQYVGEITLDKKSKHAEARASDEAARVGATHILQIENGRFALFRVDPDRWNDLPRELRPGTMAGEPVSTTTITSYPYPSR